MIMNYVQVCVLLFICHCCNIHHANYNTVEKTGVVQAFLPHSSLHLHTSSFATRRSSIDDVNNFEENAKDPIEGNFRIIKGKNKWLGGAVDPNDGSIYGVPSNANEIICLRPSSKTKQTPYEIHTIPLPRHVKKGKFKWLRGIICNNCLYGIPAWNKDGVLKLDLGKLWKSHDDNDIDGISSSLEPTDGNSRDNCVSIIPLPEEFYREKEIMPNTWLWHGAALNKNQTAIYCIPSNARQVLKVDLLESKCSFLDIPETLTSTPLAQTNKWYGGITGNDNAIYGIPYSASNVLRIDANTDRVSLLGNFGLKEYNWHGGIKSDINGCIYCFPAHHSHVLKIDTTTETNGEDEEDVNRLSMVSIKRASYDNDKVTRYKWLGGSLGADGNIYGMPSDASSILRIDIRNNVATTFGVVSDEKNKWQGGILFNGTIYAIPSNTNNILCIDTNNCDNEDMQRGENNFDLIGNLPPKKDKWQGGFVGIDGTIYCIPENFDKVMRVIPDEHRVQITFL